MIDYDQDFNSPDGKCYTPLLLNGTDILIKSGNGTFKSADEAVLEFHRIFRKFNTCLAINKSTIDENILDKMLVRMSGLTKKYSNELIQGKEKDQSSGKVIYEKCFFHEEKYNCFFHRIDSSIITIPRSISTIGR